MGKSVMSCGWKRETLAVRVGLSGTELWRSGRRGVRKMKYGAAMQREG